MALAVSGRRTSGRTSVPTRAGSRGSAGTPAGNDHNTLVSTSQRLILPPYLCFLVIQLRNIFPHIVNRSAVVRQCLTGDAFGNASRCPWICYAQTVWVLQGVEVHSCSADLLQATRVTRLHNLTVSRHAELVRGMKAVLLRYSWELYYIFKLQRCGIDNLPSLVAATAPEPRTRCAAPAKVCCFRCERDRTVHAEGT